MSHGSGAGVPPAAGASRPRIYRGRDARAGSRDGCPTTERRLMVPMREQKRKEAFHGLPPTGWRGGPWKEGVVGGSDYPGRQSLRSFALGYFSLAPTGQIEPSHWESALKARPQGAAL